MDYLFLNIILIGYKEQNNMANGRINLTVIRQEIARNQAINRQSTVLVQQRFKEEKEALIEQVRQDDVTKAIQLGPDSGDSSDPFNILGLGGKGSLFSYLGFQHDADPINGKDGLIPYLEESITMNTVPVRNGLFWRFTGRVPTTTEIYENTKVAVNDSTGRSWVRVVELGIYNVGESIKYYLRGSFSWEISRSRQAIQAKNIRNPQELQMVRPNAAEMKKRTYVSEFINQFVNRIGSSGPQG